MPSTCEGRTRSNGKRNPVRLVKTVVTRKIAVAPSKRLPRSRPYTTRSPEPIPTRPNNTCTTVNVDRDMPKIMVSPFESGWYVRCRQTDRKSTRLNSSHQIISYAVFCLKKKKNNTKNITHPHPSDTIPCQPPL